MACFRRNYEVKPFFLSDPTRENSSFFGMICGGFIIVKSDRDLTMTHFNKMRGRIHDPKMKFPSRSEFFWRTLCECFCFPLWIPLFSLPGEGFGRFDYVICWTLQWDGVGDDTVPGTCPLPQKSGEKLNFKTVRRSVRFRETWHFTTFLCHTWERWKLPFRQVASSPTLAPYLCGLGAAPGGGSFGVEADRRLHLEKAWRKRGRPVLVSEFMMNYSNSPFGHTYGPTL